MSAENFSFLNPLSANHPLLVFNLVITVGSIIAINFSYKTLSKKFHTLRLHRDCAFLMAAFLKFCLEIISKHFHYGGFIKLHNSNNPDERDKFNKSFIVAT